jgi:hypothetical protein
MGKVPYVLCGPVQHNRRGKDGHRRREVRNTSVLIHIGCDNVTVPHLTKKPLTPTTLGVQ